MNCIEFHGLDMSASQMPEAPKAVILHLSAICVHSPYTFRVDWRQKSQIKFSKFRGTEKDISVEIQSLEKRGKRRQTVVVVLKPKPHQYQC